MAYQISFDEAQEIIRNADADIAEAKDFADKEQYVTAINILDATVRGFDRVIKQYPQFDESLTPFIAQATELTVSIIQKHQAS